MQATMMNSLKSKHPFVEGIFKILEFIRTGEDAIGLVNAVNFFTSGFCQKKLTFGDELDPEIDDYIDMLSIFLLNHLIIWLSDEGLPDTFIIDDSNLPRRRTNFPKSSIIILKSWFTAHKTHPYPNIREKQVLSQETGLSQKQIDDWFINARRR